MSTLQNGKSFDKHETFNNYLKATITIAIITLTLTSFLLPEAFATTVAFTLRTSQQVYVPGETLEIFGTAEPNQVLVARIYDPIGVAIRIENVDVDSNGSYRAGIFVWPEASRNLVFGTYTVEVLSAVRGAQPMKAEVTFAGGFDQGLDPSRAHALVVKLDAPSQVTVNSEFRIFVQVTFDGALVESTDNEATAEVLGTSHIHSSNSTLILRDQFKELHPGLYYADVMLGNEGTYVIHAAAFYRGFLSHDTRLVAASASSIDTIQNSINRLNTEVTELNTQLETTNIELDRLQHGIDESQVALNDTKAAITSSVDDAKSSIGEQIDLAQQATGQISAFILPVLALISVIIALQISLFARIRASYR
jgi:hypothetical protein